MTGFRLRIGGVQELTNVTPDLTAMGKIIGGGLPVGALGGKSEIMDFLAPLGPVYQAGTLSGNPLAMAAGIASLKILRDESPYERLNAIGQELASGLKDIKSMPLQIPKPARCSVCFSEPVTNFDQAIACKHEHSMMFFIK